MNNFKFTIYAGCICRKSDVHVDKLLASDVDQKDGGTPNKKQKVQSVKVDSNGLGLMTEDGEKQKIVNDR